MSAHHNTPHPHPEHLQPDPAVTRTPRTRSTRKRLDRLRRIAAIHVFRGLCYGLGTAASGLLGYWIQQHYL